MTSFVIQTLPITILPIGGILILLLGLKLPRKLNELLTVLCIAFFTAAIFFAAKDIVTGLPLVATTFPAMIDLDKFSLFGVAIVLVSCAAGAISANNYFNGRLLPWGDLLALILFSAFGGALMLTARNLVVLFMGMETLSLAAYVLAGFARGERLPLESSIKYFVMGSVAAAIFLFGAAFYYGATGSFELSTFRFAIANQGFMQIASALLVSGIIFKAAIFPMQWWAPDVYQGAPLPVAGFFATAVKAAAILTVAKLVMFISAQSNSGIQTLIAAIAFATMTLGNFLAIVQDDIKRMMAYSSIAQAGYMLTALVISDGTNIELRKALLFYVVTYVVATMGIFAVLTLVSERMRRSSTSGEFTQLAVFSGLAKSMPAVSIAFLIMLMSLAGLPPAGGFFAKFYIFNELVGQGYLWLVAAALLNSFVSLYFYMKPAVAMFFHQPSIETEISARPQSSLFAIIFISAAATVLLGIMPDALLSLLAL